MYQIQTSSVLITPAIKNTNTKGEKSRDNSSINQYCKIVFDM